MKNKFLDSREYIEKCLITESTGTPAGDIQYKKEVGERSTTPMGERLIHASLGIATESGELIDVIKRFVRYGKAVDRTHVKEEIGDVFWYIALICAELGITFEEAMESNIKKLSVRYPEKFRENAALDRDLDAERAALEAQ